tara:strand:+ start:199 stop:348 length:150 start_codon:yes stop_codon:yes gene_type:complete
VVEAVEKLSVVVVPEDPAVAVAAVLVVVEHPEVQVILPLLLHLKVSLEV